MPAIPVGMSWDGCFLLYGLTEGPPMSIMFSFSSGPLSLGRPAPSKIRPRRFSEKLTLMGYPRNLTLSPVLTPCAPEKTSRDTLSLSSLITRARDTPVEEVISARSLFLTPSAFTVMTLPTIESIFVYTFCMAYLFLSSTLSKSLFFLCANSGASSAVEL